MIHISQVFHTYIERQAIVGMTGHPYLVVAVGVVGFAVVHHDPVGVLLGHTVRRARIEGRLLRLGNLSHLAVQLRGGRLVEARSEVGEAARSDRVQQTQRSDAVHFGNVLNNITQHLS